MNRSVVGIYRTTYPMYSETFISNQVGALRRYLPIMIVRKQLGLISFDHTTPRTEAWPKNLERLFALTGWWPFFWGKKRARFVSLVHAHFGPDGLYGVQLATRLKVPCIVTFHGADITSSNRSMLLSGVWSNVRYILARRILIRRATVIIAVSDYIRLRLIEKGCPPSKVVTHYIGVDTEVFTPFKERSASEPYVLCVARHTEKKGIDHLVQAFKMVLLTGAKVRLKLVGGGPLTGDLKKLVKDLNLAAHVDFLGPLPAAEVARVMQRAHVFALAGRVATSGDAEGLGIVFNEAAACGIPVVATKVGGIPEAVVHGETGFLAEPGDVSEFARYLDVLVRDEEIRSRMSLAARKLACESFNLRTQTAKLEQIYDVAIAKFQAKAIAS